MCERDAALNGLNELLAQRTPQAGEWAFRYWLRAIEHVLSEPHLDRVDLRDADLSGLSIRGRSPASPLRLAGICLAGARLTEARFEHVDLSGGDLRGARANRAEFQSVSASDLEVSGADLTGSTWRDSAARRLRGGRSAIWYGTRWIRCDLDPGDLPEGFLGEGTLSPGKEPGETVPDTFSLHFDVGHGGPVNAVSWSPDGTQVASASVDGTVRLWDARSGTEMLALTTLPENQHAAVDFLRNRIVAVTPGAWRYLGWSWFDPATNRRRLLPAEHFGPLPTYEEPR